MRLWLIVIFGFLSACAEPTYLRSDEGDQGALEKMQYDCSLEFSSTGLCVTWAWEKKPELKSEGSFFFRFYKTSGVDGFPTSVTVDQNLKIELYMPDMGHGSTPVVVEPVAGEQGLYRASEVNFLAMDGIWEIRFQTFKDGIKTDEVADRIHFIF